MSKSCAIAFGRCNPPTIGHMQVIKTLHEQKVDDKFLYLSHSCDNKKNPLPYDLKLDYMEAFVSENYPDVEVVESPAINIFAALSEVWKKGYMSVVVVTGSDRLADYRESILKYNGVPSKKTGEILYQFDSLSFVQAGKVRADKDNSLAGMSATKMRQFAQDGDWESFRNGVPTQDDELALYLYKDVQKGLGAANNMEESESSWEIDNLLSHNDDSDDISFLPFA